jgi:CRISPR-associated endoribonuclease Cas6
MDMLLSTVFMLRPMADALLPMTLGNAWYTAVLQLVGEYDRALATQLHENDGLKPFTTSPLQGPVTVVGKQLRVQSDQDYWVRVTSLEERLSHVLCAIESHPPSTIRLHDGQFRVVQVSSQSQDHPWALRTPYEALYEAVLRHDPRPRSQVTMAFESPTAFRSQGQTIVFPLPRLVFGSLLNRWNHYAPLPLALELVEAFDVGIDVDRYTLKTQMQDFGRYKLQVGFVGQCTFGTRKGVAAEVVWGMRLLAAFAFFAGVGYRTTMGMGQVRLLA